ncbi:MAG: DMT family transporter [Caldilineales bacterium]
MRVLKFAAVLLLWAGSFILNAVALRSLTPAWIVAARWSLTALCALALLAYHGELPALGAALRHDGRALAVVAFFGVTLLYGLQITGQARTSAVNTALLANTVPLFTALLAATWLRRPMPWSMWLGIVLALLGAWIVSAGGLRLELDRDTALGDLLVTLSSLAGALYFIAGSRLRHSPLVITAAVSLLGALMLWPVALLTPPPIAWTLPGMGAVIALGIGSGLLANLWWWETITWLDTHRAAMYIYLIPLITIALAAWLLAEQVSVVQWLGGLLLLSGVWLAEHPPAFAKHRGVP